MGDKLMNHQENLFRAFLEEIYNSDNTLISAREVINYINNNPQLRLSDEHTNQVLAKLAIEFGFDADAVEMFMDKVKQQQQKALTCADYFLGNYPPKGSCRYPEDFITFGFMPTADPTGICISQMRRNFIFIGPNGSAKTSCLRAAIADKKFIENCCTIIFCKKSEWRELIPYSDTLGKITVFVLGETPMTFFQGPANTDKQLWINDICKIFGTCYARLSAHRYMDVKVNELCSKLPEGSFPTLKQLISYIEKDRPGAYSRQAQYRESILYCLYDLSLSLGSCTEFGSSDFMEKLFAQTGLFIFEMDALASEHISFIANYFMRFAYFSRLKGGK